MKVAELLPAKKLVSVRRTKVALSVTSAGHFWRARLSLTTKDFEFLYGLMGATAPRSEIHGSGDQGLIVQIHANAGVKVTMTSKSAVACNFSCRELGITENRVESTQIDAYLVEYDDRSRYLLTMPLPDKFLSTSVRKRREHDHTPPLKAVVIAAVEHGGELPSALQQPAAVHDDTPPPETPPPETQHTSITGSVESPAPPRSLEDLRELLNMLNEQAATLKATGTNVVLRIEDGVVKASVPVTVYRDL